VTLVTGKRAVLESLRAGAATEVVVARGARRVQGLRDVLEAADRAGVRVSEVPRERLDAMAGAADHRGVLARTRAPEVRPVLGERDLSTFAFGPDAFVVVLDGIEDPQNLGAAARSAEAAGAAMLVTRTHRAAPLSDAAVRASAGALAHLPHTRVANIAKALTRLQDGGFTIAGLAAEAPTVYATPCPDGRLALVVGSEGSGMSRLVRERCDLLVALPMRGRVDSLNAAASLAAVLYSWVLPTRDAMSG
jgi:23S rRNA (guanosine2251-2'-O)-methyltransferase